MKVAVVGAGIMGLCTAYALIRRGHNVTLIDQFPIGHKFGSSHGNSRIVRSDYPDAFYSEIMIKGMALWRELDSRFEDTFYKSGLLYFGHRDSPNLAELEQGASRLGIPHEILSPSEARDIFPSLHLLADEIAYFNSQSGWVAADSFQIKLFSWLIDEGMQSCLQRIEDLQELTDYDAICLLPGGWVRHFLPKLKVTSTLQTYAYLEVPENYLDGPVWIEDQEHEIYGFPRENRGTNIIKFGVHSAGATAEMSYDTRQPSEEKADLLRDFARRRFAIKEPRLTEVTACDYTTSPDRDFRWGEVSSGMFWASPCSGHGFKFGPWIGERMADFVEQKAHPNQWPRFCQT